MCEEEGENLSLSLIELSYYEVLRIRSIGIMCDIQLISSEMSVRNKETCMHIIHIQVFLDWKMFAWVWKYIARMMTWMIESLIEYSSFHSTETSIQKFPLHPDAIYDGKRRGMQKGVLLGWSEGAFILERFSRRIRGDLFVGVSAMCFAVDLGSKWYRIWNPHCPRDDLHCDHHSLEFVRVWRNSYEPCSQSEHDVCSKNLNIQR